MRVTVIGSGTLLPNDRRRSPAHLVEYGGQRILLDCGPGSVHGLDRYGREWRAISHVAITHFHTDHTGDLPALLWAWTHGADSWHGTRRTVVGPRGIRKVLEAMSAAYGDYVLEPGSPLEVVELEPGGCRTLGSGAIGIRAHRTVHTSESLAFRLDGGGCAVGYTGDTGAHPPLGSFFSGVDLLISECSVPDGSPHCNHLSPSQVADLALAAGARRLVLTHMYPTVDPDEAVAVIRAAGFAGGVDVGTDGLVRQLTPMP